MLELKAILLTQGMHGMVSQVEGLAKAESVCAPFKDGRKTGQSPSQLASGLLLLEHAECRSALTKPSFSQSQMK